MNAENAAPYLYRNGWKWAESARIQALGGGVSNTVLLVEGEDGRFVCKQALEKLRVAEDWRSRPERSLREADGLAAAARLMGAGSVPEVAFVDREQCIFAMTAAPDGALDWKTVLLGGEVDARVAAKAGELLGDWIAGSWRNGDLAREFGDQTVFEELRLDPYYRFTGERHGGPVQEAMQRLADNCRQRKVSLVHGDWSPKNLLVWDGSVLAIDFEVVHFGDPSFDVAFLINHLALKSIHMKRQREALRECAERFWRNVETRLPAEAEWMWEATVEHLGGLMLARVDGKSPAEYLSGSGRERARDAALRILKDKPAGLGEIWQML